VGGVINIITMKPEKPLSFKAEAVMGSYLYNKESGLVGGKWGPFSAILHAGYNSTDGYRENGFLRAKDIGGRLVYDVNKSISVNFSGNFHCDDTGFPGYLTKALYKQDRRTTLFPDDKGETEDGYGAMGVKARLWHFGRIEIDLSYRHREVADFLPSFSFEDKRDLSTWGFTPRYILEKSLWNHFNKLTFGLDFYKSDSRVDSESAFGPNRSEVTKRSTGLYLLDEFSILENLILSFGYRHEWVTYDLFQQTPILKERVRDQEPAWNFGLDYLFNKRSSAFFNIKRSFRFPVSDELLQFFPTFQVNPSMKPQTGYHYETGIRHAFTDHIEANLTLFWIDLRDEIFYNPFTFTNENYPKTRRHGLEIGGRIKPLPWLLVWGNYSYIRPLLRGDSFSGNDIPGVPRHKGSIGTDIELGKGFLFNARANIIGSRHFIADWANKVERLDGYYTLDAKLSYSWKGLKAFVGVNNLFNRKYAEFAVIDAAGSQFYYPSPERNFIGGISYAF
jgi:iron complex outermembrane receptor protein